VSFTTLAEFDAATSVNFSASMTAGGYVLGATSAIVSPPPPPQPDIDVRHSGSADVHGYDFQQVAIGESAEATFAVVNEGENTLTVTQAVGPGSPFVVGPPNAAGQAEDDWQIPPAGIMEFTVTFTPTVRGPAAGSLVLVSDDPDEQAYEIALAGDGIGPFQVAYAWPEMTPATAGADASFDVMYRTSDGDETLTGLGLRLYWNSGVLTYGGLSELFDIGDQPVGNPEPDASDGDNDPDTDMCLTVFWLDFGGGWPGEGQTPLKLFRAHFAATEIFYDATWVNLGHTTTAATHEFRAAPAVLADMSLAPRVESVDVNVTAGTDMPELVFGFSRDVVASANALAVLNGSSEPIAVDFDVVGSGTDTLVFHPRTPLPYGGPYTVALSSSVVTDTVGRSTAGDDYQMPLMVAMPGDANVDRRVDYLDYIALKRHVGTTQGASWAQADFTRDGIVDRQDLLAMRASFGSVFVPTPTPVASEVAAMCPDEDWVAETATEPSTGSGDAAPCESAGIDEAGAVAPGAVPCSLDGGLGALRLVVVLAPVPVLAPPDRDRGALPIPAVALEAAALGESRWLGPPARDEEPLGSERLASVSGSSPQEEPARRKGLGVPELENADVLSLEGLVPTVVWRLPVCTLGTANVG